MQKRDNISILDKIDTFLFGHLSFSKEEEQRFKYRYMLLSYMIFSSSLMLLMASFIRLLNGNFQVAFLDFLIIVGIFAQLLYLRKNKNHFKLISNIMLGVFFLFFTTVVIIIDTDIKLIWYANLIMGAFLLRGAHYGWFYTAIIVSTLLILNTFSIFGIRFNFITLAFAILSYLTFSVFMGFSERQHQKNIESLTSNAQELATAKERIYQQARIDQLTGLKNKSVLLEDLEKINQKSSFLLLSLEQHDILSQEFEEQWLNNVYGNIAAILSTIETDRIHLYRLCGEKFAILIDNPQGDEDIHLAYQINRMVEKITLNDNDFFVTINFLIAIARGQESLFSHSELTLWQLQKGHTEKVKLYEHDEKLQERQKQNLYWSRTLPNLLKEDQLVVYYQPIVQNSDAKIVKYESLVRVIDKGAVVPPFQFLPVAKSRGYLVEISKRVIEKSFETFSYNQYQFSINITDDDLRDGYLVDYLMQMSKRYNIEPNRVFLEVLENINAQDSYYANDTFKALKSKGFALAIDDFGAEASNLSRLMTLEADIIKIDGQFIKNLDTDPNSRKIVEAIVSLAKKLDAKTVAEFVHSKEIYHIVKNLGVDYSQGYYFSPPLPQVFDTTTVNAEVCST